MIIHNNILQGQQNIDWNLNIQPKTFTTLQHNNTQGNLGTAFKPKRAGKNTSHIVFLLDDSSSMQSCKGTTISGFNEYLSKQQMDAKDTGIKTYASLFKFNGSSVVEVFSHVDITEVETLNNKTYDPRGSTNLYDGIGGVMMKVNQLLSEHKKVDRDSIIITILTDGEENASRTFNNSDIKQMIEKAEGKDWGFMFLGANVDAFAVGYTLGFNSHNTLQYDTANMVNTMSVASDMTSRMKSAYSRGLDTSTVYASTAFTDNERDLAGK